jgi:O-antigen ligase
MSAKISVWSPVSQGNALPQLSAQLYRWMRWLTFLFIFILPLWPNYAELRPFGLPNIAPTRLLNLTLFGLFVLCFFSSPQAQGLFLRRVRDNWHFFLLLGMLYVFKIISAFNALSPVVGVYEFIKLDLLLVFPVFFYSLLVLQGSEDVRRVMVLLVCSALLVSLIAIVEAVLKKNAYTMFLPIASASMYMASLGGFRDSVYRVQGSFEHPLALSEFLSAMLPFCVLLLLVAKRNWQKVLFAGAMPFICAAIYLTRSRAGVGAVALALALLGLVMMFRWVGRSKNYVAQYLVFLQIPALLCTLALAAYGYRDYFVGKSMEEQRSTFLRVEMMDKGVPLVLRNPLIGLGKERGTEAVGIKGAKGFATVDNYYLALALDAGIPAVALFTALLVWLMSAAWKLSRTRSGEPGLMAAVLGIAVFVFAVHAMIQSLTAVFPMLFLICVMLFALRAEADADNKLKR